MSTFITFIKLKQYYYRVSVIVAVTCKQLTYQNAMKTNFYDVVRETMMVTSGEHRRHRRRHKRVIASCRSTHLYINRNTTEAEDNIIRRSCYTAAVTHLTAGDVVSIDNKRRGSIVSAHTYIGFIQLSVDQ